MTADTARSSSATVGWAVVVVLCVFLACVLWMLLVMGEGVEAAWRVGLVAIPVVAWAAGYRLAKTDWPRHPGRSIAATLVGLGVGAAVLYVSVFLHII